MPAVVKAALAFIGGLGLTWVVAMVVYVVGSGLGWWVDRDGGVAMGFAFTIGPFLGALVGLVAAFAFARRRTPVVAPPDAGSAAPSGTISRMIPAEPIATKRWPRLIRAPLSAIVIGGAAYVAGILIFWIAWPYSGSSFTPMGQFLWLAPTGLGVIAAMAAAIHEWRR